MKKNIISIIVPIYNVENYLKRCIDSIIRQTYKDIQIILIDDGSTDSSGKICDKYAHNDSRITVVHKENGGLVSARKRGLEVATGKYIGFVDGDDFIEDNMYEELLSCLICSNADMAHSGYFVGADDSRTIMWDLEDGLYQILDRREDFLYHEVLHGKFGNQMTYSIWSKLFKSEFIKKCYSLVPNEQSYGEDIICLYACMLSANSIYHKKKAYYHYIYRNDSIVNKKTDNLLVREFDLYKSICGVLNYLDTYEIFNEYMKKWLRKQIVVALNKMNGEHLRIPQYEFPNIKVLYGKKIIIYGAGSVGRDYYAHICKYQQCKIVAWVDTNYQTFHYDYCDVSNIQAVNKLEYDYIIIAVLKNNLATEIRKQLTSFGVLEEKIIWEKPENII